MMVIKLKIYKLSQNVNNDYDTYDSCVVIAENEEKAKRIHPSPVWQEYGFYDEEKKQFWTSYHKSNETYLFEDKYGSWTNDLTKINVEEIGDAKKGSKVGIVVASFNAG